MQKWKRLLFCRALISLPRCVAPNVKRLCIVESINIVLEHIRLAAHTLWRQHNHHAHIHHEYKRVAAYKREREEGPESEQACSACPLLYAIHFETLSNLTLTHKRAREGRPSGRESYLITRYKETSAQLSQSVNAVLLLHGSLGNLCPFSRRPDGDGGC